MTDAWKQKDDLIKKFTYSTEVRSDIEVTAHGLDRGVELVLWEIPVTEFGIREYQTTGVRNVSTMRELAKTLNDACDFVEKSNPKWAKGLQ